MTDRTGQSAIQSIAVAGTRQTSPVAGGGGAGTGIKWHPGHGLRTQEWLQGTDTLTSRENIPAQITEISSMATIKHVKTIYLWGALETSQNVYKYDVIDQELALCQAAGKRLSIGVAVHVFSAGNVDYQVSVGRFPAYLRDVYAGLWQAASPPSPDPRVDAKVWLAPVMDRVIALSNALAARYDTHPYFEGIDLGELSTSKDSPDYSETATFNQFKRLIDSMKVSWAHTNVFMGANSAFSDANNQAFTAYMAANRMMLGGPDIRPNDFVSGGAQGTKFQRIYYGLDGGIDYRGVMAHAPEVQALNLGGNHTPTAAVYNPTLLHQLIYDKSQNPLNCSYVFWIRKQFGYSSGGTDNDQFWTSPAPSGYTLNHPTTKEFLTSGVGTIPVVTTAPTNYAAYGTDTS